MKRFKTHKFRCEVQNELVVILEMISKVSSLHPLLQRRINRYLKFYEDVMPFCGLCLILYFQEIICEIYAG